MHVLGLGEAFAARPHDVPASDMIVAGRGHDSPAGNAIVADAVAAFLAERGWTSLPGLPGR